ncbi:Asp/Glu/hydantoin racemase [Planctomycetaceae bacterium SCGC AG-212-F19]|nr:Asp/Glu/hydantoin racemase [Planctomycetaceae bacterium SCGC AG-212-F19]
MAKTLALIHTTPVLIPGFTDLCKELLSGVAVFNVVDESLIKNTIQAGKLEKRTIRRLVRLVESAGEAGAEAVLVTCSSIGPAVPVARALFEFPVLRIDEPMAEEAVRIGQRIGALATLRTTLDPTVRLLEETARRQERSRDITASLCEGAFEAVCAGDAPTHDRLVLDKLLDMMQRVDVVVLAQASMARIIPQIPAGTRTVPILSSPRLAMERVRDTLQGR